MTEKTFYRATSYPTKVRFIRGLRSVLGIGLLEAKGIMDSAAPIALTEAQRKTLATEYSIDLTRCTKEVEPRIVEQTTLERIAALQAESNNLLRAAVDELTQIRQLMSDIRNRSF